MQTELKTKQALIKLGLNVQRKTGITSDSGRV